MVVPLGDRSHRRYWRICQSRQLRAEGGAQEAAAEEREGPVQGRLYRSSRLWAFYCDLEESLGTLESTRAVYDRILDLRIATPQIILNYAAFLQARRCCNLGRSRLAALMPAPCTGVYKLTSLEPLKLLPF